VVKHPRTIEAWMPRQCKCENQNPPPHLLGLASGNRRVDGVRRALMETSPLGLDKSNSQIMFSRVSRYQLKRGLETGKLPTYLIAVGVAASSFGQGAMPMVI
jgi:hypothetical protein